MAWPRFWINGKRYWNFREKERYLKYVIIFRLSCILSLFFGWPLCLSGTGQLIMLKKFTFLFIMFLPLPPLFSYRDEISRHLFILFSLFIFSLLKR